MREGRFDRKLTAACHVPDLYHESAIPAAANAAPARKWVVRFSPAVTANWLNLRAFDVAGLCCLFHAAHSTR